MRSRINSNGRDQRLNILPSNGSSARASKPVSEDLVGEQPSQGRTRSNRKKPLRVMKFGGTSVADASCISKVVEIIRSAARESNVVVVVSAMSGVTNRLIEAATLSEAGDRKAVAAIFEELRKRHGAESFTSFFKRAIAYVRARFCCVS